MPPTGRRIELPKKAAPPARRKKKAEPKCACVYARHPSTGAVLSLVKPCNRHRPGRRPEGGRA